MVRGRWPFTARLRMCAALVFVAAIAACSGSVNTTPLATPTGFTSFVAPMVNGLSAAFNVLSGAPAGTSATVFSSTTAPTGVPLPSSIQRRAQAIGGAVSLVYVSIVLSQPVTTAFLNEVLTSTSTLSANASYFVEIDDPSATPAKITTITGKLSSGIVTFTNASGGSNGVPILAANHAYVFQFYLVPATLPSPGSSPSPSPPSSPSPSSSSSPSVSPTPTPTPTAPPPGVLSVSPATVQLTGTGLSNAILVQETGYSGTFSESDTCSGIATLTSSSATGPAAAFAVTASGAGACSATFSDTQGQHITIPVGVNVLNVPVN